MAQSYSNHAGSGVRCAYVVVTKSSGLFTGPEWHLLDGDTTSNNQFFFNSVSLGSSVFIQFDFKTSRIVDEAKWYQENTTSHGTWKWQGSNDIVTPTWTDIGSSFTLGGSATQTQTQLNGNTTPYRYYRLLGVSGSTSTNPWLYEIEFQIDSETAVAVSYANTGGEGNRSSGITTTTTQSLGAGSIGTLVNGNLTEQTLFFTNATAVSGNEIKFDFGSGASKVITEATWFQNNANGSGTWKWQGSNDGSSWTDIGSSFTLGNAFQTIMTSLSGNTAGYRYYRLLGVSGNASSSPWLYEIAFQIGDATSDIVATGAMSFTSSADLDAPGTLSSTGAVAFTSTALLVSTPPSRVTQVTGDVIAEGDQKARVTQIGLDVIADGEFVDRVTQVSADIIADVVPYVPNVRVTQVAIDVIGEPAVEILTPSPLASAFLNSPYSVFIVATGGLGALTYSLASGNITNATQTDPVVITSAGHGLISGQKILISGVSGMTELNGNYYYVNVLSSSTFSLYLDAALTIPVDGTGFTVYSGGGIWTSALPAGLTLNATTGEISGTPTEAGTFTVNVTVVDNVGNSASATYTIFVDSIVEENINLGIGVFGLGYTIARNFSGIECHFEFVDVGMGTATTGPLVYNRSQMFFPRNSFPDDQKFYLELGGSNSGSIDVTWTVFNIDTNVDYTLIQPAGQFGRLRNVMEFTGPEGIYAITPSTVASINDGQAYFFRIVAPLKKAQKFVSEIRLVNSNYTTVADQQLGSGDAWRTSHYGHEGLDDGWTSSLEPVWRYEAAAWRHIKSALLHMTIANASFGYQSKIKYSEVAFVDIDDLGEFGFSRKITTAGKDVFFIPTFYTIEINPTSLRDGHRYQIWGRSVKPDGYFTFNTFLHTARLRLEIDPADKAEIYNRCGSSKRVYLPGLGTPDPEIYFQIEGFVAPDARKLRDLGPSTFAGNSAASGSDIDESEIVSIPDDSVRSQELSNFLIAGRDYEASCDGQVEIVYRFSDVLRKPNYNYMF